LSLDLYTNITIASYDLGCLPEPGGTVNTRGSRTLRQDTPDDVGTLWTMRRLDCQARCALLAWPLDWELRIVVDGKTLLAERCPRGAEAFRLADRWRSRMIQKGWRQIIPQRVTESLHP